MNKAHRKSEVKLLRQLLYVTWELSFSGLFLCGCHEAQLFPRVCDTWGNSCHTSVRKGVTLHICSFLLLDRVHVWLSVLFSVPYFFSSWKWRQCFCPTCIIHEFKVCDSSKVHRKPAIIFCYPSQLTKSRTELLLSITLASLYWLHSWFLQRHHLPSCQAVSSPAAITISFILFTSLF